jgi:hypothetical protein
MDKNNRNFKSVERDCQLRPLHWALYYRMATAR